MNKNIKRLYNARKLYRFKRYEESLEIFENVYNENPDVFNGGFKNTYAWAIYQAKIKNFSDENELMANVNLIIDLTNQQDSNKNPFCVYTNSVFKVLKYLKNEEDYYELLLWLDKINPELLNEKGYTKNGINYYSRKEEYYSWGSIAYYELTDYEKCIEISKEALNKVTMFTNNGDVWHYWRLAKSLMELNQNEESLFYLNKIIGRKNDWYFKKAIAENYLALDDLDNALKYVCEAVLANVSSNVKINLYKIIYDILKDENPDVALKHAELYVCLKNESGAFIPDDIVDLDIDERNLDKFELEKEINDYWFGFKYKNQELNYGTITKIFEHGKAGFITSDDNESVYFNKYDFCGDKLKEGLYVSYYLEKNFDKSKNKESIKAVNINVEL